MRCENFVILVGRVVSDVTIIEAGDGMRCYFSLRTAVVKNKKVYETIHEIVASGDKITGIIKKLRKGAGIYIRGAIRPDKRINPVDLILISG